MADDTTMAPVKPGWQTTEFWLTALATLIGLAYTAGIIHVDGSTGIDKAIAFASSTLAAIGYSINRSVVKKAALTLK
jgi:hypothetical protein